VKRLKEAEKTKNAEEKEKLLIEINEQANSTRYTGDSIARHTRNDALHHGDNEQRWAASDAWPERVGCRRGACEAHAKRGDTA